MTGIIKRNLLCFSVQILGVLFHVCPFIVIGVCVVLATPIPTYFGGMDVTFMMDRWIIQAWELPYPTTMGAFAIMVADSKNTQHFSPQGSVQAYRGYAYLLHYFIMTLITFCPCRDIYCLRGGEGLV